MWIVWLLLCLLPFVGEAFLCVCAQALVAVVGLELLL